MANRRMVSKRIISSAKFLQMPLEAQALYFHLTINADDDGVVEAYPITKLLGTAPDVMKILLAKNLIKQLNEDQVVLIKNWREHNTIRADRKIDSFYKKLLPEATDTVEPKPRSDVKDNSKRVSGQSTDSISKDKLSQVKLSEVNLINKEDEDLTELLYNLIKQNYSFTKEKTEKQKEGDYEEMNRLHRIDKWTYEQIRYIIEWSQQDDFWKQNIRSVKKLRKQFETLAVRVKGQVEKREVKDYD